MAKYVLHEGGRVTNIIVADADWVAANAPQADLLAEGVFVGPGMIRNGANDYTPAAEVVQVPTSVTMRQARLALNAAGLLSSVTAAINAMSSPAKEEALITWEYSSELHREHPLVAALGAALGLNGAQIDALFVDARGR